MRRRLPMAETGRKIGRYALPVLLFVLILGVPSDGLAADEYISPLEPADTSSPRATLKAFR